jgi:hypothetical protein
MLIKVKPIGRHKKNTCKKKINGIKVKDDQRLQMNAYLTKGM